MKTEKIRTYQEKGLPARLGQYYVVRGYDFRARYLHADGTWHPSTSSGVGGQETFSGWFATYDDAIAALNKSST